MQLFWQKENKIHLYTLFVLQTFFFKEWSVIFFQSDPHFVFDTENGVQFNDLLMEPYWNSIISGTEPYRA